MNGVMDYKSIRKYYVPARAEDISKRDLCGYKSAKETACREFDEMVQREREVAVAEALAKRDDAR